MLGKRNEHKRKKPKRPKERVKRGICQSCGIITKVERCFVPSMGHHLDLCKTCRAEEGC
jgi:hypothetical protein